MNNKQDKNTINNMQDPQSFPFLEEGSLLTKEQAWFLLRLRMVTQCIRAILPMHIKNNADELKKKGRINFDLTEIVYYNSEILMRNDHDFLSQSEVQIAVNNVLTSSRCPIMNWGNTPYVEVTMEDAKRVKRYISTLTPLTNEKPALGIVDDENFSDIL